MELRDTIPSEIFLGIQGRAGSGTKKVVALAENGVIQDNGISEGPRFVCAFWSFIKKCSLLRFQVMVFTERHNSKIVFWTPEDLKRDNEKVEKVTTIPNGKKENKKLNNFQSLLEYQLLRKESKAWLVPSKIKLRI
ncbi:hypothetical protein AVEN_247147-1 [Araneus ventricosus]|uniref:Uncharacterized protein n=1 Tax=Araneus ventricosus TaxID=182803 RepID=A0A4Y2L094_ARAVE|nr:hypothetical protein AVEN_247147-1 [Araneus ventricosus]